MDMFWLGFGVGIGSVMALALALFIGYRVAVANHRAQMFELKGIVKAENNKNVLAFWKNSPQWMR